MIDKEKDAKKRSEINNRVLDSIGKKTVKKDPLILCPDGVMRTKESYEKWKKTNPAKCKILKFPSKE